MMALIRYIRKIQQLDSLIRNKATGNQVEFARKARISRSLLNIYITEMKDLGFPIAYCRSRKTYYYDMEGGMVKSLFETQAISKEEMIGMRGGNGHAYSLLDWYG